MIISSSLLAARHDRLEIAFEHSFERLFVFPFGMLRCKRLHAIKCERELDIYGV
jgi:hypothetical protein